MLNRVFFSLLFLFFFLIPAFAQEKSDTAKRTQDTTIKKNILALDTNARKFNPRVATFRSAVLPGWGQAYNKKYWKIPIVYGALGTAAGIFFFNLTTYKQLKQAIILRSDNDPSNDSLVYVDFRSLSTEAIRTYRNSYRQNIDYSVLAFIILWGLNVVDATVDAHLKSFDVSPDLSFKIKPSYHYASNTAGVSFVFTFKNDRR